MILAKNISFKVPSRQLLKGINLELKPGELMVILGANGAGKSTLMKILSGEKQASEGTVLFQGKPLNQYKPTELSRKRAVLTQQNGINLNFCAEELVMMGRYPHFEHQPRPKDRQVIAEVMNATGINHLAKNEYIHLSGGEQQRVQLARVLAQIWDMPEALLLLDEPVTSLDMQYQQQVLNLAKKLTQRNFSVLAVLHDLNLAVNYADRIMMLRNGELHCEGSVNEVITPENIQAVFGIEADVLNHPESEYPFIVPKRNHQLVLS